MIKDYVCVDIETTGIRPKWDRIIEIGAVKVRDGKITDTFSKLIHPGVSLPYQITALTGITDDMLAGKPEIEQILPEFIEFAKDDVYLLGHNTRFDYSFLKQNAINLDIEFEKQGLDTLKAARKVLPELPSRALDNLCVYFGIKDENHHRAFNDAFVTTQLYSILVEKYGDIVPEAFKPFEFVYQVKKMQPMTDRQKKYLNALIIHHNLEIDYEVDSLSKNEASRKIDTIILQNGKIF